jgi:Phage integrase family
MPGCVAAETKGRSHRRVPVAAALRYCLDEHLLRLDWAEGLVFGTSAVSLFPPQTIVGRAMRTWGHRRVRSDGTSRWEPSADALEPIGLHECRHTFASMMIAAGVNAKALSTHMGHANISITLDRYGHLMPGNEDEAAALLDAFLERVTDAAAARAGSNQAGKRSRSSAGSPLDRHNAPVALGELLEPDGTRVLIHELPEPLCLTLGQLDGGGRHGAGVDWLCWHRASQRYFSRQSRAGRVLIRPDPIGLGRSRNPVAGGIALT